MVVCGNLRNPTMISRLPFHCLDHVPPLSERRDVEFPICNVCDNLESAIFGDKARSVFSWCCNAQSAAFNFWKIFAGKCDRWCRPGTFIFAGQSTNADVFNSLLLIFASDFGCGKGITFSMVCTTRANHSDIAGAFVCCPKCSQRVQVFCLLNFDNVVFDFLALFDGFQDSSIVAKAWR